MIDKFFKGYYFKHQKNGETVAMIPGVASGKAFIQVITNDGSYNYWFPSISFGKRIVVGGCTFSKKGININTKHMHGKIYYSKLTPIKYDIMGPFKYFPMECRHTVISMHHELKGGLMINGKYYDFDGGIGYIEGDSGVSFPQEYMWLHCNDFAEKCSVMASVATIPFMGFKFMGCICVVIYKGIEYRFATYNGVKLKSCNENELILKRGKYTLEISIQKSSASPLFAPKNGKMVNTIHESNCSSAQFKLYEKNTLIFDLYSNNTSYEFTMK